MGYCKQVGLPANEPVTAAAARTFLRLPASFTSQDTAITGLIKGAREDGERLSGRILAQRQFIQVLDSFPYFTDTVQSQIAYPPSYYSLPRYSTTLWNYSQMIKLAMAPLISVDELAYIGADGQKHVLISGSDFIVDPETDLARIFPMVGQYWPPCLYVPNAVKITFTAGYDHDPAATKTFGLPSPPPNPPNQQATYTVVTGIPQVYIDAILNLVAFRFQNPGVPVPDQFERAFLSNAIVDFAPTRG